MNASIERVGFSTSYWVKNHRSALTDTVVLNTCGSMKVNSVTLQQVNSD